MTVNVGTIGHVDHPKRRVAVIGGGGALTSALALALANGGYSGTLPDWPKPKPAKRLTAADLNRIEAAEAKRQRRVQRNRGAK
jgi:nucleoside-diphosphate-sugar epimerase